MANNDRTEQPTTKRRRDAREKGQVARSQNLSQAGSMAAGVMTLGFAGVWMLETIGRVMASQLSRLDQSSRHTLEATELAGVALQYGATLALVVGPVAMASATAIIALTVVQGGWVVSTQQLTLNLGRLNPAQGIKRLGFSQGGIETLKMLLIVTVIAFLSYRIVANMILDAPVYSRLSPFDAGARGWQEAYRLLKQTVLVMLVVGAADYGVQKWRLTKSLMMTKEEVKEELKMTEGNPQIKARIRRIQYAMARRRMLSAVPKATVVITNPTHFAVALEYHRGAMAAPRVLAKGKGFLAQRIKAIAREHGVPMVENVPLAQALYKGAEVGEFIPSALFEAVAEVLAYLIRLKRLAL